MLVAGLAGPHGSSALAPGAGAVHRAAMGPLAAPQAAGVSCAARRRLLLRGAAAATAAVAGGARAEDKLLWISGKSDPIRKTSKDKVDGTKKDPK
eukprot:3222916-Prymnesium_polylepis.1